MSPCTEAFQEGPVSGRAAFGLACVTIGEKTQRVPHRNSGLKSFTASCELQYSCLKVMVAQLTMYRSTDWATA